MHRLDNFLHNSTRALSTAAVAFPTSIPSQEHCFSFGLQTVMYLPQAVSHFSCASTSAPIKYPRYEVSNYPISQSMLTTAVRQVALQVMIDSAGPMSITRSWGQADKYRYSSRMLSPKILLHPLSLAHLPGAQVEGLFERLLQSSRLSVAHGSRGFIDCRVVSLP